MNQVGFSPYVWFIPAPKKQKLHDHYIHPAISLVRHKPSSQFQYGRGNKTDPNYSSAPTPTWVHSVFDYLYEKCHSPAASFICPRAFNKNSHSRGGRGVSKMTNPPNKGGNTDALRVAATVTILLSPPSRNCGRLTQQLQSGQAFDRLLAFLAEVKEQWIIW